MAYILRLQSDNPQLPIAPGEEKRSTLSLTQCLGSAVSVLLCDQFRRL